VKFMKLTFLLLLAAPCLAQTAIVGVLLDSTGQPANCMININRVRVAGVSPTTVQYAALQGDLTGATGGYGSSLNNITSHQPLALISGVYRAQLSCSGGYGSGTYTWTIPAAVSVTVQSLLAGTATQFATIAIGATTTNCTAPAVTNVGSATAAILNFCIPTSTSTASTWGTVSTSWASQTLTWATR